MLCERDDGERGNGLSGAWGVSGREVKALEALQAGRQLPAATACRPRSCACPFLGKTTGRGAGLGWARPVGVELGQICPGKLLFLFLFYNLFCLAEINSKPISKMLKLFIRPHTILG